MMVHRHSIMHISSWMKGSVCAAGIGVVLLAVVLGTTTGCYPESAEASSVILRGPYDLLPLMDLFRREVGPTLGVEVIVEPSTDAVGELSNGRCTLAFSGRELSSAEKEGISHTVVGHDAVCVVIDENTYYGGTARMGARPLRKSDGLQHLTLDELKSAYEFWVVEPGQRQIWTGTYQSSTPSGGWRDDVKVVFNVFFFPSGKYDTQTVLYDVMGLNEVAILEAVDHFTAETMVTEAEVLSKEYKVDPPYIRRSGDFMFKLGFASRCVTQAAVTRIPVRVVAIDGMDPLRNPEFVYSREYPFVRDLTVLYGSEVSGAAGSLVEWALSAEGQAAIAQAGYLPLERPGITSS